MIEVEGPDGTVIEFPEGTSPETIKGVMAKRYPTVKSGRSGKEYQFNAPAGGDEAAVLAAAQEALRAQEPDTTEAPVMAPGQAIADAGQNALGQIMIGAGALPDLASKAATGINNAFAGMVGAITDPVLRGVGADGAADALGGFLDRSMSKPAPTIEGMVRRTNPEVNKPGNALANFGLQAAGSMLWPIGPKGSPITRTAPGPARAASNKVVPFADEIVAAGKAEGVRVKTTDVVPPRTMMGKAARNIGERIPVIGTAGERAGQQQERIDAATKLVDDFVGVGGDDAVNAVSADLAKTRGAELSKLTGMKTRIIDGTPGAVQAPLALRAISQQITRLQGINAEAFKPVIERLKNFEEVLQSGKSLSQIEGNRKLLGDLFADPSLAAIKGDGQKALNAIYGPLREDMGAFIAAQAGRPAAARWKAANDRLASMAGELKNAGFKKALNDAETTPEGAAKLIFSKTPSEVARLVANLSPAGKVKARSAVMFEAAAKSTDNGIISPQKFARALDAMKTSTRGLFDPADAARIEGVSRLIKATQRASESAVLTNSGQQLVPAVMGAAAISNPGLVISAGLLARAYESAPVRDLLLRLGRASPGSRGFKISYDKLTAQLSKIAPVAANDVDGAFVASPTRVAAEEEIQD